MRADIREFTERLEEKVSARQQEIQVDLDSVKDLAESIQENVAGLTVDLPKVKADLGGKVNGIGMKINNLETKFGDLQADFVAVKVHAEGVADGNKEIKSTMRRMHDSINGMGERMERALKSQDAEWRGQKKRRLGNSNSVSASDGQNKTMGTTERRQSGELSTGTGGSTTRRSKEHTGRGDGLRRD